MAATVQEALATQVSNQAANNRAGLDQVSEFQTITFTQYRKVVLPLDGFVFWVNSALINNDPAVFNLGQFGSLSYNEGPSAPGVSITEVVKGSVHYTTTAAQEEEENIEVNSVHFTAQSEIQAFNQIAPNIMWLAEFDGIRFAFTSRSSFYEQAGLWHYVGDAVYPDMETQIIDSAPQLSLQQVVSNSLPIWLSLNKWSACYATFNNFIPLYPSYLSPENIEPPFATVHIDPAETEALGSAPFLDRQADHAQLAKDRVRITFWGCNNQAIMNFVDFVNEYCLNFDNLGILNMPIVLDQKRAQSELGVLSQKKTIEYEVSYYQNAARDIARKLIKTVVVDYIINTN